MAGVPKIGFFGPMKGLDSAKHEITLLANGRVQATIEHDPMRGVSAEMLRWWWENIDTTTTWNGRTFGGPPVPVYRYWHPFDHIRAKWVRRVNGSDGRLGPGSLIRIEENLGGQYEVRIRAHVTRLDDHAFNFAVTVLGLLRPVETEHYYEPTRDGCSFMTRVTAGIPIAALGRSIGPSVETRKRLLRLWVLHNIEESGETEKFVPTLYERSLKGGNAA